MAPAPLKGPGATRAATGALLVTPAVTVTGLPLASYTHSQPAGSVPPVLSCRSVSTVPLHSCPWPACLPASLFMRSCIKHAATRAVSLH